MAQFIQHPAWGGGRLNIASLLFSVTLCYYKGYICYSIMRSHQWMGSHQWELRHKNYPIPPSPTTAYRYWPCQQVVCGRSEACHYLLCDKVTAICMISEPWPVSIIGNNDHPRTSNCLEKGYTLDYVTARTDNNLDQLFGMSELVRFAGQEGRCNTVCGAFLSLRRVYV